MREICTSGSTRGERVALFASPSLLLYRLGNEFLMPGALRVSEGLGNGRTEFTEPLTSTQVLAI